MLLIFLIILLINLGIPVGKLNVFEAYRSFATNFVKNVYGRDDNDLIRILAYLV